LPYYAAKRIQRYWKRYLKKKKGPEAEAAGGKGKVSRGCQFLISWILLYIHTYIHTRNRRRNRPLVTYDDEHKNQHQMHNEPKEGVPTSRGGREPQMRHTAT
jgi:hypothetical protein